MLEEFVQQKPFQFINKRGYKRVLDYKREEIHLIELDIENEETKHALLLAIMDLKEEGKTTSSIRYKGKGTSRWFNMLYPAIISPLLLGLYDINGILIGFLSILQSQLLETRKVIGIGLIRKYRERGIGKTAIIHVQKHIEEISKSPVTELIFETSKDNVIMLSIAKSLGFKEFKRENPKQWAKSYENRIVFHWRKERDIA